MENTDVYTEASVTRPLTMGASSLPQHGRVETASSVKNHAVLNEPREKCSEDFLFSGSSVFLLDRTMSVLTPEAVHVAVTKIGSILENKAVAVIIAKLCQKVENLNEFPKKLEKIRNYLTTISALISQQIGSTARGTKSWIKHVRKVCHRVEDALDKYSYHVVKIQGESARSSIGSCTKYYAKVFCEIVDEVAEVEEEIQKVLQLLQASILFVPNQLIDVERLRRVVTSWDFVKDDEDLMGTEDNRLSLTRWLHSDCQNGEAVITVCGMGGLGKTALVSQVYERERRRFDAHAWIDVSKNKYPVEVLRTLLSKIGYTDHAPSAYMEAHYLSKLVKADLESRKCLIVFDDVWDIGIYHEMREAFQNLRESRIIITTRNKNVAALAPPTRQLELQPLGKADAFQLFCRRALCSSKCPGSLEKIANSIVDMCGGLPAAILSVGGMLSSKRETQHAWTEIYSQLRSELAKNDNVQAILYVSYCDLPGDIRNCFLYCSLFAEAHPIPRESLVRLWAAEGFAVGEGQITPEDVAEENLMELIRRNMLQVVETDELGNVRTCKMHGIVRDLALSVAKEEMFGSANDSGTMLFMDKETRRLSTCEWEDKGTCRVKFPRLRTIVSPATTIFSSSGMLSSILSDSRYLTVLELQDSGITEVPTSIGNLFNLQYIGLRRTRIKSIPESIEKLSNLQTLDIKQTNIEKLPIGVSKVRKLRHLLADRIENENKSEFRYFVAVQAPIELSNLEELQTLETVQASKDLTEQLKKLTKLRSVWIDNITSRDCADLFATLSNMPLLSSLLLCASDENESLRFETLRPTFTRLQRLIIRGRCTNGTLHCPVFQGRHGRYLKYLALSWCEFSEDPLLQLAPCVPNLTYLSLNRVHTTDTLVISAGCFPVLKILVLKHMPGVNQLKIEHSALPRIQGLYIMWLYKIDQVPAGIESLQTLKKLWMLGLHRDFKTHWEEKGMHQKMQHVPVLRV